MIDDDDIRSVCAERVGRVAAFVHVDDGGVSLTATLDDRVVLNRIPLGPVVNSATFGVSTALIGVSRRDLREAFTAASGKSAGPHEADHAEAVLVLSEPDGTRWELVLRVAADGVAVRYRMPLLDGVASVEGDRTSIALTGNERLWALDYQTWYETPRFGADASALAPGHYGLPMLIRTADDDYVLITESGIDGRFSGSHLEALDGRLQFIPADASIEVTRGEISPWRVFVIGSLEEIVETQFVDELAPDPASGTDFSWVRPGRAAWSWWSDFYSGAQLDHQMRFVDEAAELGWEHLLIDCGWDATWVPEIVSYASRRGIQVHLWTVWRDLNGPENLRKLALWRSWGVAGIKVDFMESESKDRYRWYDALLAEATRVGLMVNVHGSVIPRGWARAWPNLIGYEAARGAEYYVFYDEAMAPEHNVILPFTRNVLGAMDYTPVAFSAQKRLTSDAHELALAVVYECGITHFADDMSQYSSRPLVARFLAELAPLWHETRLLAGDPDFEAVIARRHGKRWFVGVIATGEARTIRVPLQRLGLGPADVWVVSDGLVETTRSSVDFFDVDVVANGGAVAIVAASGEPLFGAVPRPTLIPPAVEPSVVELGSDGTASLTIAPSAALRLPPGWHAEQVGDQQVIHPPPSFGVGQIGIVTVEVPGEDGVALVSHARVLPALTAGEHRLSALPFLAFRNESGPVERDSSNGGGNPNDGEAMSIAGETYEHGIGVSAPSWVRFHLGGHASSFSALVGVDDETTRGWEVFGGRRSVASATARVAVVVDGVERAHLDIRSGEAAASIVADVTGGQILELRVTSDGEAHIDWANALITVATAEGGAAPAVDHR